MVKYFVETTDEDFIIEVPEDDKIQVIFGDQYDSQARDEMRVVQREIIERKGKEYHNIQFNDHVLARYTGVKAVRCEHVVRIEPEVA